MRPIPLPLPESVRLVELVEDMIQEALVKHRLAVASLALRWRLVEELPLEESALEMPLEQEPQVLHDLPITIIPVLDQPGLLVLVKLAEQVGA